MAINLAGKVNEINFEAKLLVHSSWTLFSTQIIEIAIKYIFV